MREIFFHEDDYRQIELLPLDNFAGARGVARGLLTTVT
jgi:hypothetical protein